MFCTNCGNKLPDGARFCTRCGAPVTPVIPRTGDAALEQREVAEDELRSDANARETDGATASVDAAAGTGPTPSADFAQTDGAPHGPAADPACSAASDAEATTAEAHEGAADTAPGEGFVGALQPDEGPSEDPTSAFELDDADETPTTLLSMDDVDETPTTVLSAEDDEASEDPTALFVAEEEPTSALEIEADPDEAPTTLPSDAGANKDEADETPTTLLNGEDTEDIDGETTVLADPDEVERAEASADAAAAEQSLWAEPGADSETTVLPEADASHDGAARQVSWQQAASGQLPFSEQQGQQVFETAQVPPQPQDGQLPFQEGQPAKKTHRGLIIGVIAVVVIAIALACALLIPRFTGNTGTVVAYGQTDPVELSPATRMRPRDAEGNELTSYVVKLVKRVSDDDGGSTKPSEAISDVVAQIEVHGPDGFTMEDFGDDIPAGDYTIVIVADGSSSSDDGQDFPVRYDPDGDDDSELIVQPESAPKPGEEGDSKKDSEAGEGEGSEDEFTEEELAAAYYSAKLDELADRYGSAAIVTADSGTTYALEGLAYAGLYDFDGDGLDELLTIVTDEFDTSDPEHIADVYQVAVWDYQDGELAQVFDGVAPYSNGGEYFLDIYEYEGAPVIDTMTYEDGGVTVSARMGEDGDAFSAVCESRCVETYEPEYEIAFTYYVDGDEVEESDYQAVMDEMKHLDHICLATIGDPNDSETTESYVGDGSVNVLAGDALIDATSDTMASLEDAAGDALDYVLELLAEDAKDQASYQATVEEQTETFESSQGEGSEWEQSVAWCYPVITLEDGSTNDVLDALNKSFADDYAADLAATKAWTIDSGDEQVTVHRDRVTYLEGSIACVRSDRSVFLGGAHSTESVYGTFYDLSTGDVVDVDEALGLSWSDLQAEAEQAVNSYVDAGNTDMSMDEISSDAIAAVISDKTRYLADENGVYVAFWSYELGSYASGLHLVYVHGFEDDSIVGTSAGTFEWGQ